MPKNKKPYYYSKKARRYLSKTKSSNRNYYKSVLTEIVGKVDFDFNSTYGKYIFNQLYDDLKVYRTRKGNLKYKKLEKEVRYEKQLISENNTTINKERTRIENKLIGLAEERASKNSVFFQFLKNMSIVKDAFENSAFIYIPYQLLFLILIIYNIDYPYYVIFTFLFLPFLLYLFEFLKNKIINTNKKYFDVSLDYINLNILKDNLENEKTKKLANFTLYEENELKLIINKITKSFKKLKTKKLIEFVLSENFYNSTEWQSLRKRSLKLKKNTCVLCGSTDDLSVDHIKPRSKFPLIALEMSNTQILCRSCNSSKGNR